MRFYLLIEPLLVCFIFSILCLEKNGISEGRQIDGRREANWCWKEGKERNWWKKGKKKNYEEGERLKWEGDITIEEKGREGGREGGSGKESGGCTSNSTGSGSCRCSGSGLGTGRRLVHRIEMGRDWRWRGIEKGTGRKGSQGSFVSSLYRTAGLFQFLYLSCSISINNWIAFFSDFRIRFNLFTIRILFFLFFFYFY